MTRGSEPDDGHRPYRPISPRRRLLIVGLAVCTAVVVIWLMLQPQLRAGEAAARRRAAPPAPALSPARCEPGQSEGCVGGTMGVIAPASAPR